jgi:hypothetical protein
LHETHAYANLQVFWLQTPKLKLLQISLPSKRLMSLPNLSTDLSLCVLTFWRFAGVLYFCDSQKIRSCPDRLEFKNECYSTVNQSISKKTTVYVKREGRTLFLLPKVKVEFRHLFSLQKWFSLCSYHNINANIVVFLLIDWFTVE